MCVNISDKHVAYMLNLKVGKQVPSKACYVYTKRPRAVIILLLLQSALQPLVGFRPAQLSLSILSGKVLQSAVASGTSNPQLGGEPGI
jgi:predicted Na+-dependent transporter